MARTTKLVASFPAEWAAALGEDRDRYANDIYYGSLLDAIESVIRNVEGELIIVNPYWSESGVEALTARLSSLDFEGVVVTLVTQANLTVVERSIVNRLKSFFENRHARCHCLWPSPLEDGRVPMMHAKVVIADRSAAYLGSANLTEFGLSMSIEAGAVVYGKNAQHLKDWMNGIMHLMSIG